MWVNLPENKQALQTFVEKAMAPHSSTLAWKIPWTVAQQASPRNSSGNNTGEGTHSLSPWDVPDPGMEPGSPAWQADSLPSESQGKHII